MDKNHVLTPKQEAFVAAETAFLVKELAYYHKGPVKVTLKGGNHIAYTYGTVDEPHTAQIVMNPSIIASIRNLERAKLVWHGIGYHELLHHIFPATAQYEKAIEEGFKSLFNLVDDEQNERLGRSMHAEWGRCFQSVCSFIFEKHRCKQGSQIIVGPTQEMEEREDKEAGKESGSQDPQSKEAGSEPDSRNSEGNQEAPVPDKQEKAPPESPEIIYNKRFLEFAYHFRRHLPGATDPAVKAALALIPDNFKDLSKPELLGLTRAIHHTLCDGFDPQLFVPPVCQQSQQEEATPAEDSNDDAGNETTAQPVLSESSLSSFWLWLKNVCTSKRSLLVLLLCIAGWSTLFLQKGTGFWLEIVLAIVGIIGLCIGILVIVRTLQWLSRQWLLWKLKQRRDNLLQPTTTGTLLTKRIRTRLKELQKRGKLLIKSWFYQLVDWPPVKLVYIPLKWLRLFLAKAAKKTVSAGKHLYRVIKLASIRLWKKQVFRIFLVAIPIAVQLVIIYAILTHLQDIPWWCILLYLLAFLFLGRLLWRYKKAIYDFLMPSVPFEMSIEGMRFFEPEVDKEILDFHQIHNVVPVEADDNIINALLPEVRPLSQVLRPHFAKCGASYIDKEFQSDGFDLVEELEYAMLGELNLFVDDSPQQRASVHIELALDCSSSMSSSTRSLGPGEKFKLGQLFAALIEETVIGQHGISAHFWGFTDNTIYDCGVPGQRLVSGLKPSGGNNDAAMLYHMAHSAMQSNKDVKILLMVSDGQPSECTWGTLHNLVRRLRSDGFIPVQIAVDAIREPAFEEFSVSLVGQSMSEAINSMAGVLARLIEANS